MSWNGADLDAKLKYFRNEYEEITQPEEILEQDTYRESQENAESPDVQRSQIQLNYAVNIEDFKLIFKGLEELGRKKEDIIKELSELKLRKLFDSFDEDRGGTISEDEFVKACKNMRLNFHDDDLRLLFAEYDKDQNGDLDFEEFAMLLKVLRCGFKRFKLFHC